MWATAAHLNRRLLRSNPSLRPPLGTPLGPTRVELRDADGALLAWYDGDGDRSGDWQLAAASSLPLRGEIFLGGSQRRCALLDACAPLLVSAADSIAQPPHFMRPTGDLAELALGAESGADSLRLVWTGRRTRTVKLHGHRVNLDALESRLQTLLLASCGAVEVAVDVLADNSAAPPVLAAALFCPEPASINPQECLARLRSPEAELAAHEVPMHLHVLPASSRPLTANGKLDRRAVEALLRHAFAQRRQDHTEREEVLGEKTCMEAARLRRALADAGYELQPGSLQASTSFLDIGGDSVSATTVAASLTESSGTPADSALLLDLLLNASLQDVIDVLDRHQSALPTNEDASARRSTPPPASPAKRPRVSSPFTAVAGPGIPPLAAPPSGPPPSSTPVPTLAVEWRHELGKCVDASPVVIRSGATSSLFAVVGSHAHCLEAVDIASGACTWSVNLNDRIEAPAVLSWQVLWTNLSQLPTLLTSTLLTPTQGRARAGGRHVWRAGLWRGSRRR